MNIHTAKLLAAALIFCMLLSSCSDNGISGNSTTSSERTDSTTETASETEITDDIPDVTFDGAVFRAITWDADDIGLSIEESGDILNEAVYKRDRAVEDRFDISIVSMLKNDYSEVSRTVQSSVSSTSDDFDLAYIHTNDALTMSWSNMFRDLNTVPNINLSKPWWDSAVTDGFSVGSKLFAAASDASINDLLRTNCLIFNMNLLDDKGITYPYQAVVDGIWTYEALYNIVVKGNADLNGDGSYDYENDQFGMSSYYGTAPYTLFYGSGTTVVGKDSDNYPVLRIDTDRISKVYDWMYRIFIDGNSNFINDANIYQEAFNTFTEGRAFFGEICLMHLTDWTTFRDMRDDYGVLPAPKLDETQDRYYSYVDAAEPLLAIPTTVQNLEFVGAVTEGLASESYRSVTPVLYEAALKDKYSRDDLSKAMIDIIVRNRITEFGSTALTAVSFVTTIPHLLNGHTNEIASTIQKYESAMQTQLDNMVNRYAAFE